MKTRKATITAAPEHSSEGKDSHFVNQFQTVYHCFLEKPKTTLMAALETGVLRNCITWYVAEMEAEGRIQVIRKGKDPFTHFTAGFYSTDDDLFVKSKVKQLSLFDNGI